MFSPQDNLFINQYHGLWLVIIQYHVTDDARKNPPTNNKYNV